SASPCHGFWLPAPRGAPSSAWGVSFECSRLNEIFWREPGLGHVGYELGEGFEPTRHGAAVSPVEQFDRMDDGCLGSSGELRDAADVAGGDEVRLHGADILHLAVAELRRDLGLKDVVGAGRSAADV